MPDHTSTARTGSCAQTLSRQTSCTSAATPGDLIASDGSLHSRRPRSKSGTASIGPQSVGSSLAATDRVYVASTACQSVEGADAVGVFEALPRSRSPTCRLPAPPPLPPCRATRQGLLRWPQPALAACGAREACQRLAPGPASGE